MINYLISPEHIAGEVVLYVWVVILFHWAERGNVSWLKCATNVLKFAVFAALIAASLYLLTL